MWTLNLWMFLVFLFNPPQYESLKAAGVPCWGYADSLGSDISAQPACPYDPTNVNPGR